MDETYVPDRAGAAQRTKERTLALAADAAASLGA